MKRSFLSMFFLCAVLFPLLGSDWARFLGPNKNDKVKGAKGFSTDLAKWKVLWKTNVGVGYSSISVEGELVITMGHDGKETESVVCLNAKTGEQIWKRDFPGPLMDKLHKGGPNSTPTIEGDFVYIFGKAGQTFCLNKKDGSVVWQKDMTKLMGTKVPAFGFASSPVVHGEMLLFAGSKAIALNKKNGKVIWLSEKVEEGGSAYHPGHASVVVFTYNKQSYITLFLGTGLEILNLKDGKRVARRDLKAMYNMTATTPKVFDEGKRILMCWNKGSEMLEFDGQSLKPIWKNRKFNQSFQNSVYLNGVLYGTSGKENKKKCPLMAIDPKTGDILFQEKEFVYAQVILVDDILVCRGVFGELIMVKPEKDRFKVLSKVQADEGTCWTKATYANGNLYIRNNAGQVTCYGLQ